jgi:hypothetical protein
MQASHLNKIIFYCIIYLGIWQNANGQIDTKQIGKADSLFKTNQLLEAEKIYLQFYNPRCKEIENINVSLNILNDNYIVNNYWLESLILDVFPFDNESLIENYKELLSKDFDLMSNGKINLDKLNYISVYHYIKRILGSAFPINT